MHVTVDECGICGNDKTLLVLTVAVYQLCGRLCERSTLVRIVVRIVVRNVAERLNSTVASSLDGRGSEDNSVQVVASCSASDFYF